jgi:hypothetical protein
MLRKDLLELNKAQIRKRVGNLYFNLDTRQRHKLIFGLIFFIQRCLLVLLVAIKYEYVFQWLLCQIVLMLNTAYIFTAKPYLDPDNAILDKINCAFLLAICDLTATYSAWNTDTSNRFFYGILFDAVVVL